MRTFAYVLGLIATAGIVVLVVLFLRTRDENATLRASTERMIRLESEISAVKRDVGGLGTIAKMSLIHAAPTEVPVATGLPTPAASVRRPEPGTTLEQFQQRQSESRERLAKRIEGLNDRMRTEERDPQWARRAEELVTTSFASSQAPGSKVGPVECRSKLCRVEIEHDDPRAQRTFLSGPPPGIAELPFGSLIRTTENGKIVTLAFLGKEQF